MTGVDHFEGVVHLLFPLNRYLLTLYVGIIFRIHVHNVEDLVLCVLPFHDTHAFVRIVQLLVLGFDISTSLFQLSYCGLHEVFYLFPICVLGIVNGNF